MNNYIVQFRLNTEKYQEDILDKRFKIAKIMYNSLVNITQKRYKEMIKTKEYRTLRLSLTNDKTKNKTIWKEIKIIYNKYNMSEYSFQKDIKPIQNHFKENIDSSTAQKIATRVWNSYENLLFGNGKEIHYKNDRYLYSIEGKYNRAGIKFRNNNIVWNGLKIPVLIDYNNYYESQSIENEISYCRILRKYIKNKYKYYVQIIFKGKPPIKINTDTGEIKPNIGNGDVGLDIGTSTIAISSKSDVRIIELADKVQNIDNEKRRILRKMDRSMRSVNPNNYNKNGTIKSQRNKNVIWKKSNHYIKYQNEIKELYRKQKDIRKYQHECLANYIISLGNSIFVEDMNFSGLQKQAKKTEKNESGKFKKKKRFGKSLGNRAPAMLLSIIDRKLGYYDNKLIKINTQKARASQYSHFDNTYNKKSLSQRWNSFNGIKIQRDMYSAFLIMNINDNLDGFDLNKCNDRFENFYKLHNMEVQRLTGIKNLSSISI